MQNVVDLSRIRKTPGVLGGDACIRDTRIAVSLLVHLKRLGRKDQELLGDFPGLTEADLTSAWAYYQGHPAEIEQALREESAED